MLLRFGYVAMATRLVDASPSRTITVTNYEKLPEESRLPRLRRIVAENLANTLRILRYNKAHHVHLYRFTSKLIPLATHPLIAAWDYLDEFRETLAGLGEFVRENGMRVSAHPDHFTILNSPEEHVFRDAAADLAYQADLFAAMGLGERTKMVIHVGGAYRGKGKPGAGAAGGVGQREGDPSREATARFAANYQRLPEQVSGRLILENDDRSYSASEALALGERLGLPVCLDLHHFRVNHTVDEDLEALVPAVFATWRDSPPKVHVSSPRSDREPRSHADFVAAADLEPFLQILRELEHPPEVVDLMVEAKMKDEAMFRLVDEVAARRGITRVDEANLELGGVLR